MTPERWQKIERLYHAALELREAQRADYLKQACAEDDALRQEVESLLAQGSVTGNFLEGRALEVAAQALAGTQSSSFIGRQLGSYKVLSLVGAGGMGEVYKARDTKLGREVALKVLPSAYVRDPEWVARFEREARMLAALNHPNIATIHGLEQSEGAQYLVMELVLGETLAERLRTRPLEVEEVLRIAEQITEALEAAHEKGIVHRDLKPVNVKVTPEGRVKVLDFGLAKAFVGDVDQDLSQAATLGPTEEGRILGTPAYMSPEQARGKPVDKRTDIWAFGCVLYELLTGKQAFRGETLSDTIAAVLGQEPDWQALPLSTPAKVRDLLRRCLQKNPRRRLQDVGDVRIEIGEALAATQHPPWWRDRAAVYGAAVVLVLAAILIGVDFRAGRERLFGGPAAPRIQSIAVLPLQNLSGDPSQEYFSDGMTEALTTDLARMESLQVISHTSAMQYKDAKKTLPAIARELKADVIVEGSVDRSGNQVRITAQLIRAATDKHIWAETYERDVHDILQLQDEVASAVAQQIETRLGGPKTAALPEAHRVSPAAYETYLKANYYLDNFKLSESIDYYNEAIKLDPNFAPAYAHMARAYFFLAFFSEVSPGGGWAKIKDLGTLAVEKDDRLPEAHGALALAKLHYDWDFAGAEREFKRALELNPSDADIRHDYAHYLMAMGRMAESEAESRRAVELAPVGGAIIGCLCWHSFAARDYDQSIRLAKNGLASDPDDAWQRTILGWDYEQKRMPDEAIVEFKTAVDASKSQSFYLAALGHAYALAGRGSEARQVLRTLIDRSKKSYVSAFDIASIYAGLGDNDAAFLWLNKAAAERSTFLVYSKWEPRLDPLRSDPRFQKLLQRIGLP